MVRYESRNQCNRQLFNGAKLFLKGRRVVCSQGAVHLQQGSSNKSAARAVRAHVDLQVDQL